MAAKTDWHVLPVDLPVDGDKCQIITSTLNGTLRVEDSAFIYRKKTYHNFLLAKTMPYTFERTEGVATDKRYPVAWRQWPTISSDLEKAINVAKENKEE